MSKIKLINAKQYRERYKDVCKLWLNPESLTAKQIQESIKDFSCAVTFNLDSEKDEDRLAGFTAALVEDILEMDSLTEEEKDQSILELIRNYPEDIKQLSSLAERTIKQIDVDVENYRKESSERGYCPVLIRDVCEGDKENEPYIPVLKGNEREVKQYARNMLVQNIDIKTVMKLTGLSYQKVCDISENIALERQKAQVS
jgi:hypothetical protein